MQGHEGGREEGKESGRREGGREGESCGGSAHMVLLEEKEVIEITHCWYPGVFCWLNVALDWVEMKEGGEPYEGSAQCEFLL